MMHFKTFFGGTGIRTQSFNTYKGGALQLEPHLYSFLFWLLETGSGELFPWASLKPRSS
jgi:hypothetical protein